MAKDKYVAVSGLALTPNSLKKMHKHQPTLLKHGQMTGGEMEIYVTPMKAKKMMNAVKKGKGMKLHMSPDEMEHTIKHGKGVVLSSRKIFTPPKEGMPTLIKKGVITHNAPVASLNVGNDTFEVVRGDPLAPMSTKAPVVKKSRTRKPKTEEGGKINLKDIGRQISRGAKTVSDVYKKNVRDTPVGDAIRKGAKTAIVSGITALPAVVGAPELAPVAGMMAKPVADTIVQKAGLGTKFMLNSNYNNFLNSMHPAMSPALPPPDNSLTRGGSFVASGAYGSQASSLRGRGVATISNIQPLGSAMNPLLPPLDNSMTRGGSFVSSGY